MDSTFIIIIFISVVVAIVASVVLIVWLLKFMKKNWKKVPLDSSAAMIWFRPTDQRSENLGNLKGKIIFSPKMKKVLLSMMVISSIILLLIVNLLENPLKMSTILIDIAVIAAVILTNLSSKRNLEIYENGIVYQGVFSKSTYYFSEMITMVPGYTIEKIGSVPGVGVIPDTVAKGLAYWVDKEEDTNKPIFLRVQLRDGTEKMLNCTNFENLEELPVYIGLDTNPAVEGYQLVPFVYFN